MGQFTSCSFSAGFFFSVAEVKIGLIQKICGMPQIFINLADFTHFICRLGQVSPINRCVSKLKDCFGLFL